MIVVSNSASIVVLVPHDAADHSMKESSLIRRVRAAVAVAGAVLATPDGMAAVWRWMQSQYRSIGTLAMRLVRHTERASISADVIAANTNFSGTADVESWQPWRDGATGDEKISILRTQIDFTHKQIGDLTESWANSASWHQRCAAIEVRPRAWMHVGWDLSPSESL